MCFLYRYWSCCFTQDKEKALQDTLEFNRGFVKPLDENTVRIQTRQAEKAYEEWLCNEFNYKNKKDLTKQEAEQLKALKEKRKNFKLLGYNYKNVTLIEVICIIEDEMKHMRTIIDDKEVKKRNNEQHKVRQKANRRNENGLTKKQQELIDRLNAVKKLKDEGYKQKDIADVLGISLRTVKSCYKELNDKQKKE